MKPAAPEIIAARFRRVVTRGLERADRETAEHLARIKALPRLKNGSRQLLQDLLPTKGKTNLGARAREVKQRG